MEQVMYYLSVFVGTVLFCIGIVFFLKQPFYQLATSSVKQLDIILNKSLSEEEKDKHILRNLASLLKWLFLSLFVLILLILGGTIPAWGYLHFNPEIEVDTSSFYFYLSMIGGSFSLLLFKNKDDYSYWSKMLHNIILNNYSVGQYLFKREVKKHGKQQSYSGDHPFVIVSGLARAGTTALTNLLYNDQRFHSINYANVPFLMAPNTWKKVYNPKTGRKRERAHGDQVQFDEKAIEALEEYFFKVQLNDHYIHEDSLNIHEVDQENLMKYYTYQDLFRSSDETLYLAKNNNFILRYESLRSQNAGFKLIIVFRNPVAHAKSLMQQHKNFVERQSSDRFELDYMNWLGHYEFGLNHKFFDFGYPKEWEKFDKDTLSFWVAIWSNYYAYVLELKLNDADFLVHYDDLRQKPAELKATLFKQFDIAPDDKEIETFTPRKGKGKEELEIDPVVLGKANAIYQQLLERKLTIN